MEKAKAAQPKEQSEEEKRALFVKDWAKQFFEIRESSQDSAIKAIVEGLLKQGKFDFKEIVANQVLSYLEPQDLFQTAYVNSAWNVASEQNALWQPFVNSSNAESAEFHSTGEFPLFNSAKRFPSLVYESREPDSSSGTVSTGNFPPRFGSLYDRNPFKSYYLKQTRTCGNWTRAVKSSAVKEVHGEAEITCMKMGEDFVVTAAKDSSLILSKLTYEMETIPLIGHTAHVTIVEFSPCGKFIFSGSADRTIKIWYAETGKCIKSFHGHMSPIAAIAVAEDIAVSSDEDYVIMWNWKTGKLVKILLRAPRHVNKILFDGTHLFTCAKGRVQAWDPVTLKFKWHVPASYKVSDMEMSELGFLIAGCENGNICVISSSSGMFYAVLGDLGEKILKVKIIGTYVTATSNDMGIGIWCLDRYFHGWYCRYCCKIQERSPITDLQIGDFPFMVTNSADGIVKLYSLCTGFVKFLFSTTTVSKGTRVYAIQCSKTKLAIACGSNSPVEPTKLVVFNYESNFP